MFRIFAPGLFGMVMMALWIYAIFDVIATDSILVRNLPKGMWVGLVVFFPLIGSIAWLTLGRPTYAGAKSRRANRLAATPPRNGACANGKPTSNAASATSATTRRAPTESTGDDDRCVVSGSVRKALIEGHQRNLEHRGQRCSSHM